MKKAWPTIYAALIPVIIALGYTSLSPERTARTDVDWTLVSITFVVLLFFPLGAVAYGFSHSKKEALQKPTWDRPPLGWWTDTLQPLRVTLAYMILFAIGQTFALPNTDEKGRMMFFLFVAMSGGLFIGERFVYAFYRKKIAA